LMLSYTTGRGNRQKSLEALAQAGAPNMNVLRQIICKVTVHEFKQC